MVFKHRFLLFSPKDVLKQERSTRELILLSIDGNIDICNSVAITPDGKLIISLVNDDYYKLGLGGKASFFDQSIDTRHVVKIDLTDDAFTPGKKEYEHARQCLNENIDQRFNVILKWEPKVDQVCPSSIASWFHEHGYHVSLCCQKFNYRTKYSLTIPTMENGYDNDKFFEWLGVFSIAGEMKTDDQLEEYVNTYQCPEPFTKVGQAHYLQWKGFFTRNQIEKIYNLLKTYISEQNSSTWISLDVQGFLDCPISWQLNEHTYFMDGDNSYTIVLLSNDKSVIRKSLSSNNKPTLHQ
ncbi:ribonuclease P protein subunit p40-like isoform X3 [Prorops nasuta]|uniref:ribonuclease P protein subunit p40-like isoform X3 n=1 Tax=Prorops nasuta TaxID=863751 RepID=UPI0034CF835E